MRWRPGQRTGARELGSELDARLRLAEIHPATAAPPATRDRPTAPV
ncbi:hypothetical protein [Pseudonocardia ailaonensis]